jgi:hypothetical protein
VENIEKPKENTENTEKVKNLIKNIEDK